MENHAQDLLETYDFESCEHLVDVEGLSSPKVCHLLNQLVARLEPGERYLEIGTWKGLTLCSAAINNQGKHCIACDKFRFWGQFTGPGFLAKRALLGNLQRYRDRSARVDFHHMTSKQLFDRGLVEGPIGVYFYDGDHSDAGTYHGVVAAAPHLADRAILLMDDYNDPVIRAATERGFEDAGLEVLWSTVLEGNQTQEGWWNGLGVFHLGRT